MKCTKYLLLLLFVHFGVSLYAQIDITTFTFPEQAASAIIDATNHTIDIELASGTTVISLAPTITISENATISPVSGASQDFTTSKAYTVTSEDATSQKWTVNVSVGDISASDYLSLVALYNATDGANWNNNGNWLTGPMSSWFGVTVINERVTKLELSSNSLTGTIPPELGNLSNLTELWFNSNSLIGSIPVELGNLSNLRYLFIHYNSLSGSIPAELGNLNSLQYLGITDNSLSGSIPPELGNLSNLLSLSLFVNSLSGNIPAELGNLTLLRELHIGNNNFTGNIPPEIGDLSNLISLSLNSAGLSGNIPPELGKLSKLLSLTLYSNSLSGNIPPELGNLSNLAHLSLRDNSLSGNIPPELGNLSNLSRLRLYNNSITGSIPPELGNLANLTELWLYNNSLTGNIPSELGNLSNLWRLYLYDNLLSGIIPPELGNLSNLANLLLNQNNLSGSIPPELGGLTKLDFFWLQNNSLSGSIPGELGMLSNLKGLDLTENQLSGNIPAELGDLDNLTSLKLGSNNLHGNIPEELGGLDNIRFIYLSNNDLTGSVPIQIQNLDKLSRLYIESNLLEEIPDLSGLGNLQNLKVENNNFHFDDIFPNIEISDISYTPQNRISTSGPINLLPGDLLDVSIPVGGTGNLYQWVKGEMNLDGQVSDNLIIENIDENIEGTYFLSITNPSVPNLTLRSDDIIVNVRDSETNIIAFGFIQEMGTAIPNETTSTIDVEVEYGTDVSILVPTFIVSTGATVKVGEELQLSGISYNDFSNPVVYTIIAEDGKTTQNWTITVSIAAPSNETEITAFNFLEQTQNATINPSNLTVEVVYDADLSSLVSSFTLSDGASAKVGATTQVSGSTSNDFSDAVTYSITAQDGSTSQDWTITVTLADNIERDINAFSLQEQINVAAINTTDHTINVEVAYGTDISSLISSFTLSDGATAKVSTTIQVSGSTSNDFSDAVTYSITAQDGSTSQDWTVTVTFADNIESDITSFSLQEQTNVAAINTTDHTINVEIAYGADISSLISSFTLSDGATAKVGTTIQLSGSTSNDFSEGVTYSITAQDGSTSQDWIVTMTIADNIESDITAFSLLEQTNFAAINTTAQTVNIEVVYGTDISSLVSSFTLSDGATAKAGTTTQVSGSTSNDFSDAVTYSITAQDGSTSQDWLVSITIAAPNEKPTITPIAFEIEENSSNGTIVGQIEASDTNGDALIFSIISGNLNGVFKLGQSTGQLEVSDASLLDYEIFQTFNLVVQASDGKLESSASVKIDIQDLNENPDVSSHEFSLNENSKPNTLVGVAIATDPDGDELNYSIIAGNELQGFGIDPNSGEIYIDISDVLDFEANSSFKLEIQVSDGELIASASIKIDVNDVNESPVLSEIVINLAENTTVDSSVGSATAFDPESDDLIYSIISGNEGRAFQIDQTTGELSIADSLPIDFENTTSFTLGISVSDGELTEFTTITININNVNESPQLSNAIFDLNENAAINTSVGQVTAFDPEGIELTYSIVSGNESKAFQIDQNTGELSVADPSPLDFETSPMFSLGVLVNDGELTDSATINVEIADVNDIPTDMNLSNLSIDENLPVGASIGILSTGDEDTNDTHYYSLVSGDGDTDNPNFSILGSELLSKGVFDFESETNYSVRIQTDDGNGGTLSKKFTILIHDIEEIIAGLSEELREELKFYPNPVSSNLVISILEFSNFKVKRISDINGRKVIVPISILKNNLEIDFSSNSPGIYFISFEYEGSFHTVKIQKQ